jgi:hypothetical protein
MKKTGKILLSIFAAVAIMASMLVVPVSAENTVVVSYHDLEGYSTGTELGGKWEVAEENGNKYLNAHGGGIGGYYAPTANTGTGGIIKASFDFRSTLTAGNGFISLYNDANGPHDKTKMLTLLYKNDQGQARCANNGMFTPTINTWYTEEAIINLDTKKVIIRIYDKSTGVTAAYLDKTLEPTSVNHDGWAVDGDNGFDHWLMAANDSGGNGVLDLDNLKIERFANTNVYTETVQSSEDLESYATGTQFGGKWEVLEENGNKFLNSYGDGVTGYYALTANTGTGGIIKASFDFRFSLTAGRGFVSLYNGVNRPHDKTKMVTLLYKDEGTARCANNGMFTPTINTWYSEEAIIDLDTRKVIVTIYDKSTGSAVAELNKTLTPTSVEHDGWAVDGDNSFDGWVFAANDSGGDGVLDLDNFKVIRYSSGYLFSQDYQRSYAAPSNGAIVTYGSDRYLQTTTSWQPVTYNFNSISSDKIRVAFNFKNDATNNNANVVLGNSGSMTDSELLTILYLNNNGYYQAYSSDGNTRRLGARVANTWLSCEAIADIDSKKVTTTIKNKETGEIIGTQTATLPRSSADFTDWPNTITAIDTLRFVGSGENAIYVDDIVVEKIITAPIAEAENVKVYDYFSALQSTWTAVSPASMTYNIDFETNMDSSTVTSSNIYVKAAGAGSAVSGTVTYSSQVATLTLLSALTPSTTYTLHIDGDVANTAGVTLGTDKEYTIITTAGTTSADMGAPTIGGSAAGNFSTITAGQTITVPVTYVNTTGIAKTLHFIYAYFGTGENSLKKFGYSTTSVGSSVIGNNYNFTHDFQNVDGAVSLKFMIWDGFDRILSLSLPVTIKN